MIICNINIKNDFIHYEGASISFPSPGIYLLLGPNGSGKTTLIESIVYDDLDAFFSDAELEHDYRFRRYRLFAYMCQNMEDCDMSVMDYILKDNPAADREIAEKLLQRLSFSLNDINGNVRSLSCGERVKIAFISAVVKKTPYIFLDEPTNYLDDSTAKQMMDILKELSNHTVIVIASHDDRLLNMDASRYYLNGSSIRSDIRENGAANSLRHPTGTADPRFCRIALRRIDQPLNSVIRILTFLCALGISFFLQYFYYVYFDSESIPCADTIVVYSADMSFEMLNKSYCSYAGIEIDEASAYNLVYTEDIPEIAEKQGCESVYIQDPSKYDELRYQLDNQNIQKQPELEKNCFAIPERLYRDEGLRGVLGVTELTYLTEGRLPKDGAGEVSISKNLLRRYFNFSEAEASEALGRRISYHNRQYCIVGIQYFDVCVLSYEDSLDDCGFYKYDPATFSKFKARYEAYLENNDYAYRNIDTFAVITSVGMEKTVLDRLIRTYPANNYYSAVFTQSKQKEINSGFILKIGSVTIAASLLLGLCFMFLQKEQSTLNLRRLNEYNRYYCDDSKINRYYRRFYTVICIGILGLDMLFMRQINLTLGMMQYTLLLNLAAVTMLMLPGFVMMQLRVRKTQLKTTEKHKR